MVNSDQMGKKRKCLKTIGTASNPLKCGKGSGCLEKDTGCILWHPPDEEQDPPNQQHPPDEQHLSDEQYPPNQEQSKPDQKAESLYRVVSEEARRPDWSPEKEEQEHRVDQVLSSIVVQHRADGLTSNMVERQQVHVEEEECEATMVALHKLASSIKVGADKESREAFKILIQEYRPKGCQK